jgi:hypothetical protein
MARDDLFRKYQEAGTEFIEQARERAEEFFREVNRISDAAQKQARDVGDESRRTTDQFISTLRRELAHQLEQFGFVTGVDTERVERLLDEVETRLNTALSVAWARAGVPGRPPRPGEGARRALRKASGKKSASKKSSAKKSTAKKTSAKKTGAKKTAGKTSGVKKKVAAKKAPGKKTPGKKTTAKKASKKTTAKKAPGKKTPGKKTTAKKASAKKTTGKKASAKKATAKKASRPSPSVAGTPPSTGAPTGTTTGAPTGLPTPPPFGTPSPDANRPRGFPGEQTDSPFSP